MMTGKPGIRTNAEILFAKRCSLYTALEAARAAGNITVAKDLMAAIWRYADDPVLVERELRSRGLVDPVLIVMPS